MKNRLFSNTLDAESRACRGGTRHVCHASDTLHNRFLGRVMGGRKQSRDGGRSEGATPLEVASRASSLAGAAHEGSAVPEGGTGAEAGVREGGGEGEGEGKKAGVVTRVMRAVRDVLGKGEAGGGGHNLETRLKRMWSGAGNEDDDGGGDDEKETKEVNWSKVFLGEKLKVETGWDPEGDGMTPHHKP